ncbi:pyrroline-5-carboxylate reductase [Kingella oralis]|uniref:pyrroline-5-carboxylate reductase n=1 Tax=Kingella oralis TaxID=505 RepID=UPI002D7FBCF7|nr:pyrroline-5-carboxylate reductase [Kingella oralis]
MTIYFLGGGNMAAAIVAGLHRAGRAGEVHVTNRGAAKREALAARYGVAVSERQPEIGADDVLILAVKPQDMQAACADVRPNGALVISLAAGLSVATLSRYLGGTRRLVRVMPNTPAQVGEGVAGLFADSAVGAADRATAEAIIGASCRLTFWLGDEAQMHAVTAVSGSGSAYVFYLMHALQQAAQGLGFGADEARALSLQTFRGAVELAAQSGADFAALQDAVTSKGGTTFAALETFRRRAVAEHLREGVNAAAARSVELGRELG